MRDPKEFNEANEQDLEQVAGGSSGSNPHHFRCPTCGSETWQDPSFIMGGVPTCMDCLYKRGDLVRMVDITN